MLALSELSILVVEDDADSRELLEMFLESQGARVRLAASADEARASLEEAPVDVILTDASLPGEDGFAFVAGLRSDPATRDIPAIAITGHADEQSRRRALDAGFQKFITKPFDVFALAAAIASVVVTARSERAESSEDRYARLIATRDMRTLLATLNAPTPYRYTSILRFGDDTLESVWTFDRRHHDNADTYPPDAPVQASYCDLVRATGEPVVIIDALSDARVKTHPKRSVLRAYCGVPIFRADGTLFGTLCHYDEQPQTILDETVAAMARIAGLLAAVIPATGAAALATA